jgi:hypothetical protein
MPGERFSTKRLDTFTQTVPSPNFKPLAVRRRTTGMLENVWDGLLLGSVYLACGRPETRLSVQAFRHAVGLFSRFAYLLL